MKWHMDQSTFNKECANYPGFVTKYRVSNQFSDSNDHVGYENYRHVCHKWHYKITKALVFCLESKDYMQIRNAFIILIRILPHFPVLVKLSQIIERKVDMVIKFYIEKVFCTIFNFTLLLQVREEEKTQRRDLFALASCYLAQLKAKSDQMISESDFHHMPEKPVKATVTEVKDTNGDAKTGKEIKLLIILHDQYLLFIFTSEKRDIKERTEKKSTSNRQQANAAQEKEVKKATPSRESRENSVNNVVREKTSKELKKEERQREKEREREESDARKREKEKRRDKRAQSPYETQPIERYYPSGADHYENERDRDRERDRNDRDLSSVSNSSNGSAHLRSQDPPEHDRGKLKIKCILNNLINPNQILILELKRRKLESISSKVSIAV